MRYHAGYADRMPNGGMGRKVCADKIDGVVDIPVVMFEIPEPEDNRCNRLCPLLEQGELAEGCIMSLEAERDRGEYSCKPGRNCPAGEEKS